MSLSWKHENLFAFEQVWAISSEVNITNFEQVKLLVPSIKRQYAHEGNQNLTKKKKIYCHECCKNLLEDKKQKLVEYRRMYYIRLKRQGFSYKHRWECSNPSATWHIWKKKFFY